MKVCNVLRDWTITVPDEFTEVVNGDSWQGHGGNRTAYVSPMKVMAGTRAIPAKSLCDGATQELPQASADDSLRFNESGLAGAAVYLKSDSGHELRGFMCVDGHVAMCAIAFTDASDRAWAAETWKSLRFAKNGGSRKPWWRFW